MSTSVASPAAYRHAAHRSTLPRDEPASGVVVTAGLLSAALFLLLAS